MRKLVLLYCFFMASCGLFDGTNSEVSYIHFTEAKLITTNDQGANTHSIKDLWIELDGLNLGLNPLPSTVPFLPTKEDPFLLLNAGIRPNGILGNALTYPMYDFLLPDIDFIPNNTDTLTLTFQYKEEVQFPLIEGFEGSHLFTVDEDGDLDTYLEIETVDVLTGGRAGRLKVTEDHPRIEVSNSLPLNDVPTNGTPVYLELDYKCDATFIVGLIGIENGVETRFEKLFISPQENWNKIYIDFSQDILESGFESYRVLFILVKDQSESESTVLIDNVKMLYF